MKNVKTIMPLTVAIISVIIINSCQDSQYVANMQNNGNFEYIHNDTMSGVEDGIKYFWYNGKYYKLTPDYSKLYVVSNSKDNAKMRASLNEGDFSCEVIRGSEYNNREQKKYKWQVIDNSANYMTSRAMLLEDDVTYVSPFYISEVTGNLIGVSNLLHIKLKDKTDIDVLQSQLIKYEMSILSQNEFMPEWYTIACNNSNHGNALDLCMKLHETGLFAIVEPDFLYENLLTVATFKKPNDPYYSKQWNLSGTNSINWPDASVLSSGNNVSLALIDTGVDPTHPDLRSSSVNPVYDSYTQTWYANGLYGEHGMNCAGIIAAAVNNNIGIAGISPRVILHSYADKLQLRPNISHDLAGALCMALRSVDVISCSWGGADLISSEITNAINYYMPDGRNGKGTVVVFSSGNDNSNVLFPANCNENILVVGSTDKTGNRSYFSNFGPELDIMAPGESIYTLGANGESTYGYKSDFTGTSASCPQVAAIAALILSINSNLTNVQVADIIEQTARKTGSYNYSRNADRPNGTWSKYMGYGLVDAAAAVKKAQTIVVQ